MSIVIPYQRQSFNNEEVLFQRAYDKVKDKLYAEKKKAIDRTRKGDIKGAKEIEVNMWKITDAVLLGLLIYIQARKDCKYGNKVTYNTLNDKFNITCVRNTLSCIGVDFDAIMEAYGIDTNPRDKEEDYCADCGTIEFDCKEFQPKQFN